MGPHEVTPWRATAAHHRALVAAPATLLLAALGRRLDLVLIGLPFLLIAAWSLWARPNQTPEVDAHLGPTVVHEGQSLEWSATLTTPPGTEDLVALLAPCDHIVTQPDSGGLAHAVPAGDTRARLTARLTATRWGERDAGLGLLSATSPFGAFRWAPPQLSGARIRVLPEKDPFTTRVGMPHPQGIVGLNRSARRGDGTDFAAVRAYGPGDRLRRINWRVSTRSTTLQVTATHADEDTSVQIVLDAFHDIGASAGLGGTRSSLDTGVRATAALTEHYLRAGERVGLLVLGTARLRPLAAAAGPRHLRRVLDSLAMIRPGTAQPAQDTPRVDHHLAKVSNASVVIVLTPGVSDRALDVALRLGNRGLTVVVIDTLPPVARGVLGLAELTAITPIVEHREIRAAQLAWRLRLLERAHHLNHLLATGIPVIEWSGPGSLDETLRQVDRRARAPRLARR